MVKRSARDGRPELICGPSVSGLRRFMMGICVSAREEEVRVRKRSVNRVGRCMVMVVPTTVPPAPCLPAE